MTTSVHPYIIRTWDVRFKIPRLARLSGRLRTSFSILNKKINKDLRLNTRITHVLLTYKKVFQLRCAECGNALKAAPAVGLTSALEMCGVRMHGAPPTPKALPTRHRLDALQTEDHPGWDLPADQMGKFEWNLPATVPLRHCA